MNKIQSKSCRSAPGDLYTLNYRSNQIRQHTIIAKKAKNIYNDQK